MQYRMKMNLKSVEFKQVHSDNLNNKTKQNVTSNDILKLQKQ